MANSQGILFLLFIINGLIIGILFDIFRIVRKTFKNGIVLTSIEDIIFWILTGIIILYSIFVFNNGIIRGYMFLGIFSGFSIYMLTFSKFFIKINVSIINIIKKIVLTIFNWFFVPIKATYKLIRKFLKTIFRPFSFVLMNFQHILCINYTKLLKKSKKTKSKEGF